MKLTQREKEIVEILRNLSGENFKCVENVLRGMMAYTVLQYADNELITIPRFGSFKIQYKGDITTEEGRDIDFDSIYFPSKEVRMNIGTYEDIKNKGKSITDLNIVQDMCNNTKKQLEYELS